jgi:predicted NUDIX family NTP pyrophosphohydrolase
MNLVKDFNSFINEEHDRSPIKNVAGIAIVWNNSVLLVHPTNGSWKHNALGIPKGGIEHNEDPMDAAIRELREETGIIIRHSDLNPEPLTSPMYRKDGSIKSQLIYFTMNISELSDIGLSNARVPKDQLQLKEVDWAGFVKIDDAYPKMHRSQIIILDRLR